MNTEASILMSLNRSTSAAHIKGPTQYSFSDFYFVALQK